MTVGVNCGHTAGGAGYGVASLLKESEHTRLVGYALMEKLRKAGIKVYDCTVDRAESQTAYLARTVELANGKALDWFISIHFNTSGIQTGNGVEVYTYKGAHHKEALAVCSNIAALGFKNRGVKDGSKLYVIRRTKARAMLIEVCFCDNQKDVDTYRSVGEEAVAQAIFEAL